LGDSLHKISSSTSAPYGTPPSMRSVQDLLKSGVIIVNKQAGPSSHQVAAWLRDSFELEATGHGGTLDPNVTGVLPVSIGRASKVIKVLQESSKEYICNLKLSKNPGRKELDKVFAKFVGPIYQIPPFQAAVKRELRIRRIYDLEILEHSSKSVLFRVECEGGTYIRNLCDDIGSILGMKGEMEQLIRTKSGPFNLEDSFSLIEAHDTYQDWKSSSNDELMKKLLRPLEDMLVNLPKIEVKDSAVDAICHGADLAIPGISAVSNELRRGQLVSLLSGQGECIALGRATIDGKEIINKKNEKGKAVKLERVIMERGTYPREWKSK
tara:strand:+ start:254 stop:1225 length:972 start_codon:yes stop_codon:yes gene_type:complete